MTLRDDPVTLRLMVFNIEEGGVGVDLGQVVEAIRPADPDVVALQEAMGNTVRIADALGWGFASHRSQLLSRHPLVDPPVGAGASGYVEVRPGRFVAISSVHPPAEPYGPELVMRGGSAQAVIDLERRTRLARLDEPLAVLPRLAAAGMPASLVGTSTRPRTWIGRRRPSGNGPTSGR